MHQRLETSKYILLFPLLLVLYEISTYLANDMYLPALPSIVTDLNTNTSSAQQTITIWFLGTMSLQLFLGPLSDRLGRRPILLTGGIIFILATVICAKATNITTLLLARFLQGCVVCTIGTTGYSSIHELFEQSTAIRILAIMGSITILAPSFGPLLGGIILQWLSWRWIFVLLAIMATLALIFLWFLMPESNPLEKRQSLNWARIVKNYVNILGNRKFTLNTLIFCFTFLGMIAWIAAGPFLVIDKFKYSTLMFGIFQAMVFSCVIIGANIVKNLVHRVGPKRLISNGLMLSFAGGISAFLFTFFLPHFLLGLVISLMIFTLGSSISFPPSHRIAIESCPEPMGARMAIFSTLMALFGAIGGLLVSLTYNQTLFWFGCLLLILACLAVFSWWAEWIGSKGIKH
jgi:Bcr/CflA subfamily drug resistance transporter